MSKIDRLSLGLFFCFNLCLVAAQAAEKSVPLIDDTTFQRGFWVIAPDQPTRVVQGKLVPFVGEKQPEPLWDVDQWSSRFSLIDAKREERPDGSVRFADAAKAVVFFPDRTREPADSWEKNRRPDMRMEVRGIVEYKNDFPKPGSAWPHLLLERHFIEKPRLSDLESVRFRIRFRIAEQKKIDREGWNDAMHTAQFQCYLTINNLNEKSPGYGDYLWFGVPMYDTRYRHTPEYKALDFSTNEKQGTGKFICNPAGKEYFQESAIDGNWITIDRDILPLLRDAVDSAWERGYLPASKNLADYGLGCMNIGWEVPGAIDVAAEFADFLIEVQRKD